jgi:hypothetical protein
MGPLRAAKAATSIAFADPEHVQIIKSILGHGSLVTSTEYYDLTQSAEASSCKITFSCPPRFAIHDKSAGRRCTTAVMREDT